MHGSCECGAVAFESDGPWDDVTVCHCSQCRKTSGHIWASSNVPVESLKFIREANLVWRNSSDIARRGFCGRCGSSLFYQKNDADRIAVAAGSLEAPTELKVGKHIFEDDKGDYYSLKDHPVSQNSPVVEVHGSCECGRVSLTATKPLRGGLNCHCDQCRKASGHFWAGVSLAEDGCEVSGKLVWYQSTDVVKKAFCGDCGSTVFWWLDGRPAPMVSAGILDAPTGVVIEKHIFVSEKGDYYQIDDDLPQAAQFDLNYTDTPKSNPQTNS